MNANMLNRGTEDRPPPPPSLSLFYGGGGDVFFAPSGSATGGICTMCHNSCNQYGRHVKTIKKTFRYHFL